MREEISHHNDSDGTFSEIMVYILLINYSTSDLNGIKLEFKYHLSSSLVRKKNWYSQFSRPFMVSFFTSFWAYKAHKTSSETYSDVDAASYNNPKASASKTLIALSKLFWKHTGCLMSSTWGRLKEKSRFWKVKKWRYEQDLNLRGETPLDFKSNALTTRPS